MENRPNPTRTDGEARAETFSRIVHEHARLMYRVAHSLLRHPQDAEDAVQEALLKLYRGDAWQQIQRGSIQDERAFLARCVWRTAFDRMQVRFTLHDDPTAELRIHDHRLTPEEAATQQSEQALLNRLIDALPEDLRQPLLLSTIDELNSREIAAIIGIPEGTVRTRLMRARSALRKQYESLTTTTTRPGETAVATAR